MGEHHSKVDLHVHSNRSDGTFSPTQLVDYAVEKGLSAFALTDHDTTDGLEEAISYASSLRRMGRPAPEVIPGIEFSTVYQGRDVHIVGLYLDYKASFFQARLKEFVDSRIARNHKMCGLLQQAGVDITYDMLLAEHPGAVITRAHYGKFLLKHGYVKSISEAFERYVGDDCPCFVPREKVTPAQAVQLILDARGVPVLAHPILYHMSDARLDTLVRELKQAGLQGIEAIYSTYCGGEERQIRTLAARYGLLISGGSDFHGATKPGLDLATGYGRLYIPEEIHLAIKKQAEDNRRDHSLEQPSPACASGSSHKLLFTDMDGTLLNDRSEISPAMKKALDRMTQAGHHLILSSGRPLPSILEVRRLLGLEYPNMLVISNNGALVHDCDTGRNILEHRLSLQDIRYIVEQAEKNGIHIHAYTDTEIVCHGRNAELDYYTRRIHLPLKCVGSIPDALEKGSFKLQCIHLNDRGRLEDFSAQIAPYCQGRIQLVFSNDQYLEILPGEAGKGSALTFVRKYLQARKEDTLAAGDAENDISMLKAAHTAVAMANSSPAVKAHADIITSRDNNHDGLLEIIAQYIM